MTRMRPLPTLLILVLLIAACGDGGETTGSDGSRVAIEATEFAFAPDLVVASAGETIEFIVTNGGTLEHEFRVTNQADIDAHIAGGHQEHMGDGTSEETGEDMGDTPMLVLQPGETRTLTVTIPDDPTAITRFVCLIPGHYEAGMVGDITR
jgi:uncharacterized cupredoxin-like copper-binding protein